MIFMDHMMPRLDGVKATLRIRQMNDEYFRTVPIIALTANAIKSAQELFKKSGFNDFVPKPVEFKEITRVLLTWLPKEYVEPCSLDAFATDADWNEEIQSLSEILDITVVKKYFSGKMDVYMRALRKFINDSPARNDKIREAYDSKDWENYIIYVHSLKSSCATIGAIEISNMAKKLEVSAKAGVTDYINTHTEKILEYMKSLLEALQDSNIMGDEKCNSDNIQDLEHIEKQQLNESLKLLKDAIYMGKIGKAEDIIEEINGYGYNGISLREVLERIKVKLDDFMLDDAITLIDDFVVKVR